MRTEAALRMGAGAGPFEGPINERPPAATAAVAAVASPISREFNSGPGFDLFYIMPATPESISRGTLLFRVCMRVYTRMAGDLGEPKTYLQLSCASARRREKPVPGRELGGN